ncbi:RND superfamily putative drug exporter [Mumia flava]|uniref:RND superfamily putative drug exporter n=1 Tax=Mumia flava TaxID=1348852 RepID=A0A2M9BE55_9ACTN|nr:MMPL family transporter [Mumia flava]PJJ56217.1 RND superfamily putative drug exporter [Mumia flava]
MNRWADIVTRHARAVLGLGLALVVLAGLYGTGVFSSLSDGGFDDPDAESARAAVQTEQAFGHRDPDVVAVYSSDDLTVDDAQFRTAVADVVDGLPADAVTSVTSYLDPGPGALVSDDRHAATVTISLAGSDQDARLEAYDEVAPTLQSDVLETDIAGQWAVFDDVNETVSADIARAEMISMPLVLLLSLVVFGSVVAALMPVGVGMVAVLGAFAVVRLLTTVTDVSVFAINVITLLGLGLAIDYALFVVSRFREELAARTGDDAVAGAVRTTIVTAGRTVLVSGLTVALAMSSLLIFPQTFLRSMAYGGMAAVLVAMVAALTLLPATLMLLGRRIEAGAMPWRRRARRSSTGWARFAHAVMRRPVVGLVLAGTLLIALASPFLQVAWGSVDERVLPADSPARVAAEKLAEVAGQETSSAEVLVEDAAPADVTAYAQSLGAVPGVDEVTPVAGPEQAKATADGTPSLLRVSWEGTSQSEASQCVIDELRSVPAPGEVLIGGPTAQTVDMLDSIGERLPWMAGLIAVTMFALLFVAFGSVVLPIKAILVNIVSISAAFGVVTWIFAEGHLEGLLGFTSTGYLDGTQPILMAAILFGLSMDYEVFLLSRIREEWDATGDNVAAVAAGVQKTGRIITSAALLLAVVIGAFATSGIVFMKMIGVGMLVAVLLDATVVRLVLVPATMRLLGRANWWAPGPMRRWWERYGLREGPSAPVTGSAASSDVEPERILAP